MTKIRDKMRAKKKKKQKTTMMKKMDEKELKMVVSFTQQGG